MSRAREAGFTLIELIIASLLLGFVYLISTTLYVSAWRFLNDSNTNQGQITALVAFETVARKAALANNAQILNGGEELQLRWDYALGTYAPLRTPDTTADDTWIKFRYFPADGSLRWRNDTTGPSVSVAPTDPEVQPGLRLIDPNTAFALVNPSSQGAATVVNISLRTTVGTQQLRLTSDITLGARAKN